MKMIVGGAYQGQLEWAKEQYPNVKWMDGETCSLEEIYICEGIYNFHTLIKRMLKEQQAVETFARELIKENPNLIIVSDEIGYGLVPVDKFDRMYREQVGRVCTDLAAFSDTVVRVVMGRGVKIK